MSNNMAIFVLKKANTMIKQIISVFMLSAFLFSGCQGKAAPAKQEKSKPSIAEPTMPIFNADSAYAYIQKQVDFGYRIPNTPAHKATGQWLEEKLRSFGADVVVQEANLRAYDGTLLASKNIIGQYNPAHPFRVLLLAHWDTRPFADNDPDPANHRKPVLGANDAASGVGVLLEMARMFSQQAPHIGVDILFVDSEDYGKPNFAPSTGDDSKTWALGSQYWARNPHKRGYKAQYAILLDMVGAKNATFLREGFSDYYASSLVDTLWAIANQLGYASSFVQEKGGYINDDHYYINTIAGIPAVDIIHLDKTTDSGFFPYWHTVNDDMLHIDKKTLKAVGETVAYLLYNHK